MSASDPSSSSRERDLIEQARLAAEAEASQSKQRDGSASSVGNPFAAQNDVQPIKRDAIPGYELQSEIHRGGQGVVYLAVQLATGRRVAIKVLRDGPFADAREILRFEREMEILSKLEHPNIVSIIDRGIASDQHWFAMDYIAGPSLDEWLQESKRTQLDALKLFAKVCSAVQAAHLLGVVHRDLKPSNIRVDGTGEPHVLDFGLARSAGDFGYQREMTNAGEFVGTPAWASPEQIDRDPSRIDQRTDVYLLGMVLYKLLTGRGPWDLAGHLHDLWDAMKHNLPSRPRSITRDVDDELETIVLKAMHPERERRYQSVHAFASDVEHYLRGEPIDAKRDSSLYRARKFVSRNRAATAVSLLGIVALASAAGAFYVQRNEARDARRVAENALRQRDQSRLLQQTVDAFIFQPLVKAFDPSLGGGESVTLKEYYDSRESLIEIKFAGESPEQRAQRAMAHSAIGRAYQSIRSFVKAREHLEKAATIFRSLGSEYDWLRADGNIQLAAVLKEMGLHTEAKALSLESLQIAERLHAPGSFELALARIGHAGVLRQGGNASIRPETIRLTREGSQALRALLAAAESSVPEGMSLEQWRRELTLELAGSLNNEAIDHRSLGDPDKAIPLYDESIQLLASNGLERSVDNLLARTNRAWAVKTMGDTDFAIAALRAVIADLPKLAINLQADPRVALPHHYLALILVYRGVDGQDRAARKTDIDDGLVHAQEALQRIQARPTSPFKRAELTFVLGLAKTELGAMAGDDGRLREARQNLESAFEYQPEPTDEKGKLLIARIRITLGVCLCRLRETGAGLESLEAGLKSLRDDLKKPETDLDIVRAKRWLEESRRIAATAPADANPAEAR